MAKRKFRLPGVQELNKDQDRVLRLPREGQFLIIGGPGTGKSVVALLRVLKYKNDNDYIFLVYNKVLKSASEQLLSDKLNSGTWHKWYYSLISKNVMYPVPEVKPHHPNFDEIINKIRELETDENTCNLIVDEGQDMPPKFYESLLEYGFTNFFVVADQNQQITEQNSSRRELTDGLGLQRKDVIELKQNYRNSFDIARLAQCFYCDPASPKPDLPNPSKKSISTPTLFEYDDISKAIYLIYNAADRDPRYLIGVITPNNEIRVKYYNKLNESKIMLDNPKPKISTYNSGNQNAEIDFGEGGIVVLNAQSVKGTEFDIVFIADIDQFYIHSSNLDPIKKLFYVMVSRAIKQVALLKSIHGQSNIESILPKDESILKRKRIADGQASRNQ